MEKDKCFNCQETKYLIYNTLLADTSCENCGKWASQEEQVVFDDRDGIPTIRDFKDIK